MPELPDAETIARALNSALKKRKITKVEVFAKKLRSPLQPLVEAKLVGRKFTGCRRRARYAVADLDDGRALTMHFGMSGVVRVEDAKRPRRKHEHAIITLDDGRAFRFEDPRRFGSLEVQRLGSDGWPECLAGIGVEPLSDAFTGELLFASQIRPQRRAARLTRAERTTLVREAKRILALAIEWGGTTVHDFKSVDGSEGKFVQKLRIYGQKTCPDCGTPVAKVVLGGRTSWYCPNCQK